jgi:hypothetical protein
VLLSEKKLTRHETQILVEADLIIFWFCMVLYSFIFVVAYLLIHSVVYSGMYIIFKKSHIYFII